MKNIFLSVKQAELDELKKELDNSYCNPSIGFSERSSMKSKIEDLENEMPNIEMLGDFVSMVELSAPTERTLKSGVKITVTEWKHSIGSGELIWGSEVTSVIKTQARALGVRAGGWMGPDEFSMVGGEDIRITSKEEYSVPSLGVSHIPALSRHTSVHSIKDIMEVINS